MTTMPTPKLPLSSVHVIWGLGRAPYPEARAACARFGVHVADHPTVDALVGPAWLAVVVAHAALYTEHAGRVLGDLFALHAPEVLEAVHALGGAAAIAPLVHAFFGADVADIVLAERVVEWPATFAPPPPRGGGR